MEARVGARAVHSGLVPVLQIVLDVAELVMSRYQVVVVDICALFDSENKVRRSLEKASYIFRFFRGRRYVEPDF